MNKCKLGDYIYLYNGKEIKKEKYNPDGKYNIYGSNGIIGKTDNYLVDKETVIIGRVGANCGAIEYSNDFIWISDNAIYSLPIEDDINMFFLSYLLKFIDLNKYKIGSGQPLINQTILSNLAVNIPPIEEQEKIANVLSALDNKIEINNQINKDLEEIAQTLYTKWFVNFDFPNEEGKPYKSSGGEMIDSELGKIPVGWNVGQMIDYFDFIKGTEVGSSNYLENPLDNAIRFIRVGDMETLDSNIYVYKYLTKDIFCSPKDVLISMDGSVGRVVNGLSGCYSSGIRNVVAKNELFNSKGFIYLLLKSERTQYTINQFAHGSIIKHASKSINYIKFIVPSEQRINEFKNIVEPLYNQIIENKLENQQLKETRDLLLPYLMSGKIIL